MANRYKILHEGNLPNPIQGSGTANYIPKFTGLAALGNSPIFTDGTNIGVGTESLLQKFNITGGALISSLAGVGIRMVTADASGVLSSQAIPSGGTGMTYPGVGIALSTGTAWDVSITNNSANWNTAYGWGNHAGLYSTDIHANITALNAVSGTNTGDNAVNSLYSSLVSFPGFGTTNITAAYGNHNHSGVYELSLGNPGVDGYILSSTIAGVRSWVAPSTGGASVGSTLYLYSNYGGF